MKLNRSPSMWQIRCCRVGGLLNSNLFGTISWLVITMLSLHNSFKDFFSVAVVAASNYLFIVSSQVKKFVNRVQGSETSKVF